MQGLMINDKSLADMTRDLSLERIGGFSRLGKRFFVNPVVNYVLPTRWVKYFLARSKSPFLKECLVNAGGWRSMELSYEKAERAHDWLDFVVTRWGAMPMALRNRKQIVSRVLAALLRRYAAEGKVHVLGIGAGPSRNLLSAVLESGEKDISATCIDLDDAAFAFGREIWKEAGLHEDAVQFLQGDAVTLKHDIKDSPQIVKLVGILEYLDDATLDRILKFTYDCLAPGGCVVSHGITSAHGVDPFMRRVFGLHLRYRSAEDLMSRLAALGFGEFESVREPLGVYDIFQAQKPKR